MIEQLICCVDVYNELFDVFVNLGADVIFFFLWWLFLYIAEISQLTCLIRKLELCERI